MTRHAIPFSDLFESAQCDWICMPFKDKRRGSMWLCKWCRLMQPALKQPECPINIDHISTKGKG